MFRGMGMPVGAMTQNPMVQKQGLLQQLNQGLQGAGLGQNPLLGLGMRMMAQSQGQGFGRPAAGFGQGLGRAMMGQMADAQALEQAAYRNNLAKQEMELAKAEAEAQADYRKDMLDAKQRSDELANARWQAEQAAANERLKQEMAGREKIANIQAGADSAYTDRYKTIEDYVRRANPGLAEPEIARMTLEEIRRYDANTGGFGGLIPPELLGSGGGTGDQDAEITDAILGDLGGGAPNPQAAVSATTTPPPQNPTPQAGLARSMITPGMAPGIPLPAGQTPRGYGAPAVNRGNLPPWMATLMDVYGQR